MLIRPGHLFKGPHVTTKVPDMVVLGMRKQVKNLKKAEKT